MDVLKCARFFFLRGSADVEGSSRAAVSEGDGYQAPGGDIRTAEEVREQVQRSVFISDEVRREEQRDGRPEGAAAGRATRQQVKPVGPRCRREKGQLQMFVSPSGCLLSFTRSTKCANARDSYLISFL